MPKAGVRRVAVIGAGYVGLPTAAILSHHGHHVTIAERDQRRFDALRQGRSPIVEHGLDEMLKEGLSTGRLRAVQRAADAVAGAEFVFLCVETPQADDGSADLSSVTAAAAEIAPHLADGAIIVNKSTVPVGTVGLVERVVGRADVVVVSNPEFLREGTAVADSLNPDRVVVGADDREAAVAGRRAVQRLGRPVGHHRRDDLRAHQVRLERVPRHQAHLHQHHGRVCARRSARTSSTSSPASGTTSASASSSCAPDLAGAARASRRTPRRSSRSPTPRATTSRSSAARSRATRTRCAGWSSKIADAAGGTLAGRDRRGARPVVQGQHRRPPRLARRLDHPDARRGGRHGARASIPTISSADADQEDLAHLTVCDSAYEAVEGAHAIALLTEWAEFRWLDYTRIRSLVVTPAIVDARNLLDSGKLHRLGFTYSGIGRA